MTLNRLNHALAFVFGGYQDYDKFYTPSLLDEDGGLFVAILEQLTAMKLNKTFKKVTTGIAAANEIAAGIVKADMAADLVEDQEDEEADASAMSTSNSKTGSEDENDKPAGEVEQGGDKDQTDQTTAVRFAMDDLGTEEDPDANEESVRMKGATVNAARLALAHVQVKTLKGHAYNIFEAAFFYDQGGDIGEYLLNGFQVVVTYLGMFYLFYFLGVEIRREYQDRSRLYEDEEGNEKEALGILAINVIGLGYFFFLLGRDIDRVVRFNKCMRTLCPMHRSMARSVKLHRTWALLNNYCVNVWMGYALFVLNFFFVQSVDNMVDAILNAIAIVFIIQIDDVIPPYVKTDRTIYFLSIRRLPIKPGYWFDWENDGIHCKLMKAVENFLSQESTASEEVTVTKVMGHSVVFRETDVCYFFVNKDKHLIRILQGRMGKDSGKYNHLFNEVRYRIEGNGAIDFLDAMADFECVQEESGPEKVAIRSNRQVRGMKSDP